MRIGQSERAVSVTDAPRPQLRGGGNGSPAEAPRSVTDVLTIMGIPSEEMTPTIGTAVSRLMSEIGTLRETVDRQRARIAYLEQLADQDSLTSVANRRAFMRELARIVAFNQRYGATSGVIFFDLNGLKAINDTHGHAAGDAAILQVADVLNRNVRESDFVGRLGGDEFGVVMTQADEAATEEKARALVKVVEAAPLDWNDRQIPLRLAYGVHIVGTDEDLTEALDAADRAMYAHKRGG